MADGTISSKLQLDGEQQYKKALNDAYRALRVMRSELKAETAELGRNASEQDKARTKMQSLQKQIQQQEKIVKTLEQALAASKKEYADNAEVQDKWEEKLNKARAALAEMQNALGDCEDGLSKFNDSMQEAADSSGEAMQTVVSFNDAMKSIGNIASGIGNALSGIFTNTVDTMKDMVDEMFSLMGMAWSAAGDWKSISEMWGGDLESIEKVFTAMNIEGIDSGDITGGIQKLVSNTHSGNKDTAEALKQLHIEEKNYSDHWSYFVAVMEALSARKGLERDQLAMAIFGDKKGAGMNKVLAHWRDGLAKYQENYEETGLHLYDDEIQALDDVGQKITEIQNLWNGIKTNIGAKLSDVLNMDTLSDDTLTILRDIGAILNSDGETRAELVLKLSDDIEALIKDVSAAMENLSGFLDELGQDLQKSDNPLVQFIGKVISGLSGILDWLGEHGTEITGFLEKALPWILQNKILEATTGEGIGGWAKTLMDLGLDVATLTMMGKTLGKGVADSAVEAGATIGTSFLAKLGAGLPEVLAGVLLAIPILDMINNPDKYMNYDLHGGLPDNIGKTNPTQWRPLKDFFGSGSDEAATSEGEGIMIPSRRTRDGGKISGWEITKDQAEALESFWDIVRKSDNPALSADINSDAFLDAFAGIEEIGSTLYELMMSYGEAEINGEKGWDRENVPDGWYQIVNDINGSLKNLVQEKYSGSNDEDLPGRIASAVGSQLKSQNINVSVYVDGERVTEGVNTRLGSMLASGVFG